MDPANFHLDLVVHRWHRHLRSMLHQKPKLAAMRVVVETQCGKVKPAIINSWIPCWCRYSSKSVPIKALLTNFWITFSSPCGPNPFWNVRFSQIRKKNLLPFPDVEYEWPNPLFDDSVPSVSTCYFRHLYCFESAVSDPKAICTSIINKALIFASPFLKVIIKKESLSYKQHAFLGRFKSFFLFKLFNFCINVFSPAKHLQDTGMF